MLNLHALFNSEEVETCFHRQLDLAPALHESIAAAKTKIRDRLRTGIPQELRERKLAESPPVPRFFTQGSWAYKTLNAPAKAPQQADVDDGCYMPMSFLAQSARPSVAAAVFFEIVEKVLAPFARERGWKLVTDKATCVRLVISPSAHIDIPLYAIPDAEFETLAKALTARYGSQLALSEAMRMAERDAWSALPRNSVLLAHREQDWMESDPRPVKDWFLTQVDLKGEQLRRVVRYLKAFRDWNWDEGGPASILLMAAATPVFEKRERRDDLALLDVVTQLPAVLRKGVKNPTDDKESLSDRLGSKKIDEAIQAFERLEGLLRGATDAGSKEQACIWMRDAFGPRFPMKPDQVKVVSVAATIAATPAAAGASELVGRTKAG
ncbi:MAG: hypothetical protein IBJ04_19265 [Hydrogenophaga sp.]|uniref:CBASS cGAMP synthase n=1 Tax=Hydrogenophaga sp. TaxID=1904254 RepID=UPI00257E60E6|nr:CBASS cGAMP synthase [Hydrogenophaga sp.]MBL0946458.1 hypothetical protein [Hydrogenophaga sp.]